MVPLQAIAPMEDLGKNTREMVLVDDQAQSMLEASGWVLNQMDAVSHFLGVLSKSSKNNCKT